MFPWMIMSGVVIAAHGYPGEVRSGDAVSGVDAADALDDVHVLHAGTTEDVDGLLVSSGGRVLSIVGTGADLLAAREEAYRIVNSIRLPGSHFRSDIALVAADGRITPA